MFDKRKAACVSLVDSGCSGLAFMDYKFAVKHRLPLTQLQKRRPLFLADSVLSSWVEFATKTELLVGDHWEQLQFFITTLSSENPIILGLPWLRRHDPVIEWDTLRLTFREKCNGCRKPRRFQATVEEVEDEGEQLRQATVEEIDDEEDQPCHLSRLSAPQKARRTQKRRQRRQQTRAHDIRGRALARGPRWTLAPPWMRARLIDATMEQQPQPRPQPTTMVAGLRRRTLPAKSTTSRLLRLVRPVAMTGSNVNHEPQGIKLLNIASFNLSCRQKGVMVRRLTMKDLEEAVKLDDKPQIQDLPEDFFKSLLRREGAAQDYKDRLPMDFHNFVDEVWAGGEVIQRVTKDDIEKFFAKANKLELSADEIKKRLPAEYRDLFQAFLPAEANTLPPHRSYDHKIEVLPGARLPSARNRPFSPTELRVIKRWLDDNLVKGFIRPSKSSSASPLLLARKPGGGIRICVDYRAVNNASMKSRYPIPLIKETLDAICKAEIFTKLDVIAAFNRVRIAEGHEWLTAFITRFGLYETLVTLFGLQRALATFQHYMNDILYDMLDDYVTAYLDDILIYSKDPLEHVKHVREVLKRLIDAGLQVDIEKCDFHTKKTKYLGLIVTPGGIEMDPEKVSAVTSWEPPTTRKQLQRFLSFANFY